MKKYLEDALKNLPGGLFLENDELFAHCADCGSKIVYEIRMRNIHPAPFYCKSCSQKHRKFTDEGKKAIADGVKKRMCAGKCTVCGNFAENRTVSGMCKDCAAMHSRNAIVKSKSAGYCIICGAWSKNRDQNGRGMKCGCSKK